jgi:signal transduction histidine kinase
MVRRIASLAVPFRLLLFLVGILLATLVLFIIGLWYIQNEELIAEANYRNAMAKMKNAIFENVQKETETMVKRAREIQNFSSYEDFLQDSLQGILSSFVFKNGSLFYPRLSEDGNSEIYLLDSGAALELKEFLALQNLKKFAEAREYALHKINSFRENPSIARLNWDSYFLEKMIDDILSEEKLSKEERGMFSRILIETRRMLQNLNTYSEHRDFLLALGNYACYSKETHFFIKNNGEIFLVLSSSSSNAKNAIVVKLDSAFYSNKMSAIVSETAKEWSYIPYSISGEFPFFQWDVAIEEDGNSIKKRTQKIFLYLLLIFSLIIPVVGVVVVYRGFSRERLLRLMKDNFLSSVTHELKTPLTNIEMRSALINSGRVQNSDKIISYTNVILKETGRLANLIDAILNYTKMESGKRVFRWEKINMTECVETVCNSLDVIANGKGLEIKREIADNCEITGDYSSIYSLIQNLVDNAIKYTAKGHVLVKLETISQSISLSVEDTGRGIPANEQKNIFEDFYRVGDETTRDTKGSGLGLAIVKRAADAHKASITLKSSPGKGSSFTVVFKN